MPPRDYKNRRTSREAPPKKAPGWLWLLAGLLVGLFVAALVYLKEHRSRGGEPVAANPPVSAPRVGKPPSTKSPPAKAPKKPRFEFYTILPEMEVPVSVEELPPRDAASRPGEGPVKYLLQVGSFRSFAEADRLKAELALMGLEADIQTVSIDGKATWHRVRLGPFTSRGRLNEVRRQLRDAGVSAILLKVKV